MATLERQGYKAYKPEEKDKFDFWQDVGLPIAPAALTAAGALIGGPVGAQLGTTLGSSLSSTLTDQDRERSGFAQAMDVVNTISPMASQFIGGTPNLPKLAKYGGSMNKKSYKTGGNLITIPGRKHADGGTNIGNNSEAEVNEEYYQLGEDSDFIFSNADELKFGGKTPASVARKVKSKYSLRPHDKLSKESKEMELNALMQKQESLKESLGMDNDMNMFYGGGNIGLALAGVNLVKDNLPQNNPLLNLNSASKTPDYNLNTEPLESIWDTGFNDKVSPSTSIDKTPNLPGSNLLNLIRKSRDQAPVETSTSNINYNPNLGPSFPYKPINTESVPAINPNNTMEHSKLANGRINNYEFMIMPKTPPTTMAPRKTTGINLQNTPKTVYSARTPLEEVSANSEGGYGSANAESLQQSMLNNPEFNWGDFDIKDKNRVEEFQNWANQYLSKEQQLKVDGLWGPQTASFKTTTLNPMGLSTPSNLDKSGKMIEREFTKPSSAIPETYENSILSSADKDTISPFNLDKAKQLGNVATAAQLATAIPGLTTRASDVNYDRVTAPEIDLSSQRRASELSRDRIIASNRAGARGADSAGMALNFLGAANAGAQGQYGNEVAQSFLSEEQFNKQAQFEASGINANISRAEQEARIAEEDAARSIQLQSLADMAGYVGMGAAGQNQLAMAEGQINMLGATGDFMFGTDEQGNPVFRGKKYVDTKKYGGVIKRNRRK